MSGNTSVLRARRDVYKVYQIWQQVHRVDRDALSGGSLAKKLNELIDGHVAGRCALAQSLPRILTKVSMAVPWHHTYLHLHYQHAPSDVGQR